MKLILLGAPGAGKGTQSAILSERLGIPTVSTGTILRDAVRGDTPMGRQVKEIIDTGGLVPDDIVIGIIKERLRESDCEDGYILDGVPRTVAQAQALETHGIDIDAVLSIEISDDELERRVTGRRTCPVCGKTYHIEMFPPKVRGICDKCGTKLIIRKDDEPEVVKERLKIYHEMTEPVKDYYREGLLTVKNVTGIKAMSKRIFEALGLHD